MHKTADYPQPYKGANHIKSDQCLALINIVRIPYEQQIQVDLRVL